MGFVFNLSVYDYDSHFFRLQKRVYSKPTFILDFWFLLMLQLVNICKR